MDKLKNIPENWWPDCYVTEDGMIFTPVFDDAGVMTKTGEQAYTDWFNRPRTAEDTTPSTQDIINANIMARLAELEGVANG